MSAGTIYVILAIAGAIGWTAIMLVAFEVRQRRADELAEFRRTIEALRRIAHDEDGETGIHEELHP